MNRTKLIATLQQIKALAEESVLELGRTATGTGKKVPIKSKDLTPLRSLPAWILRLRDQGVFKQPKTAKEAHAKLQLQYPCDLNRVEVALLRLQKRKELRKASKGAGDKKQVAYVW